MKRYKSLFKEESNFPLYLEFQKDYKYKNINGSWEIKKGWFLKKDSVDNNKNGRYIPTSDFGTWKIGATKYKDAFFTIPMLKVLVKNNIIKLAGVQL